MSGSIRMMAHLVAGYPDIETSLAAANGLVRGGAAYIEVQIPFSDPSADGPAIMNACSAALRAGCRTADALHLVSAIRTAHPDTPVFVMAYASIAVTPGIRAFARAAAAAGAAGLIVPDLPFDADEGLADACAEVGLVLVPVAAPSMHPDRLARIAALGRPYLYAALRSGITGAATDIQEPTMAFLSAAGAGGSRILGGFGIRTGAQARALADSVHAVVAGTVFVEAIAEALASLAAASTVSERSAAVEEACSTAAFSIVGDKKDGAP